MYMCHIIKCSHFLPELVFGVMCDDEKLRSYCTCVDKVNYINEMRLMQSNMSLIEHKV